MNIKGIELKKFKEIDGHGDSRTFSADIYMDGKSVGSVNNSGWGGPNEYHYRNEEVEKKFIKKVKEWAKENKEFVSDLDPEDSLVEELINFRWLEKQKKKNLKKGFSITVSCKRDRKHIGKFSYWSDEWVIGLRNMDQLKPYIKKEKVEEYKVF